MGQSAVGVTGSSASGDGEMAVVRPLLTSCLRIEVDDALEMTEQTEV
jgi:hypothetical protein